MVLLVWIFGAAVSLAAALVLSELGAMFPQAGGLYVYLREAYGPTTAFLYGWASMVAIDSARPQQFLPRSESIWDNW